MTFAVIKTGGKQYKVSANDTIRIEKLDDKAGKKFEFKEVLLTTDNTTTEIGSPMIDGAYVEAELLKQARNDKVIIFKKRRRQNSRRKRGHRQHVSIVKILKIYGKSGKLLAEAKNTNTETKTLEKKVENKTTAKK
ncbi:MAG: 50S ribosomal protein L21 [Candidatus Fonsibacter sp.]|jgi:large subunit ribosomal protein L21|uniref:50S ribosomal protein L21 n=1 Tax=Candidatus Fonsibacter ubiquis TaxID=1925548 RepID=UPI000C07FA4D|nr:50S ribosomal protein L21 [Candidatus Fonsibacter ubiquis]MBU6305863.1 50S ribosomal protein L21 [Pseudomonadota bacterium]GBL33421.1 50S ribosomal protein L21 [Pelagibacterales bacterium]NCU45328.1 50S ribosomal protein L21 [Candidatus Fonsibacter ubiquis]NCU46000.1 50S ribosomal protein L21 [Candidatus Fonsibacter ubiquis]NCU47789.1 50S ribosomal protein L21 [Candidatus Fonsibacter ubiquis]